MAPAVPGRRHGTNRIRLSAELSQKKTSQTTIETKIMKTTSIASLIIAALIWLAITGALALAAQQRQDRIQVLEHRLTESQNQYVQLSTEYILMWGGFNTAIANSNRLQRAYDAERNYSGSLRDWGFKALEHIFEWHDILLNRMPTPPGPVGPVTVDQLSCPMIVGSNIVITIQQQ